MQEDFDIVTLTSENVLDYVDHTQMQLLVGRNHSGRSTMGQILALLTAEALFDQGISLTSREEMKCLPRPVFVDDEQIPAGTDRAWRGFVHMGLKNWPIVFEQNAHHSYTPSSFCLTLKTPFSYVVHAVSGVFESTILDALDFYKAQALPAPMFLANHRLRNLATPELLKPNVHFCSLTRIVGNFGPNEFASENEGYTCILTAFLAKNGRLTVYGYGMRNLDDHILLLPLPADAVRAALAAQDAEHTGRLYNRVVDTVAAFKAAKGVEA